AVMAADEPAALFQQGRVELLARPQLPAGGSTAPGVRLDLIVGHGRASRPWWPSRRVMHRAIVSARPFAEQEGGGVRPAVFRDGLTDRSGRRKWCAFACVSGPVTSATSAGARP